MYSNTTAINVSGTVNVTVANGITVGADNIVLGNGGRLVTSGAGTIPSAAATPAYTISGPPPLQA